MWIKVTKKKDDLFAGLDPNMLLNTKSIHSIHNDEDGCIIDAGNICFRVEDEYKTIEDLILKDFIPEDKSMAI